MQTQIQERFRPAILGTSQPDAPTPKKLLFRIYKTHEQITSADYDSCLAMIMACLIPFVEIVDMFEVIKRSDGKADPQNGFVIEAPDGEVYLSWVELSDWFMARGV